MKNKIILTGTSHVRGCSEKLVSILGNSCEVTGYVKPKMGLEVTANSARRNE
jgi:hypothetical protein